MRSLLVAALVQVVVAGPLWAQEALHNPTPAERAEIAAETFHAVKRYFAHWPGVPAGYDFDAAFRAYLSEAMAAPDRRGFTVATSKLYAGLTNGHTLFMDRPLRKASGTVPFEADRVEGKWTVLRSQLAGLAPGDVITRVDGKSVEAWIAPVQALVSASDQRNRDSQTFASAWRLPRQFVLGLDGGRTVAVDLDRPATGPVRGLPAVPEETQVTVRPDGVVVIRIPSFGEPKYEEAAVKAVRQYADPAGRPARAILFDVRENGGGSTPTKLLEAIMTAPYAGTVVETPFTVARFEADAVFQPEDHPLPGSVIRYGPERIAPKADAARLPMAVLADRGCGSACEDFTMRFKGGKRGPLVGETTGGSTGQPYYRQWPELGMALVVSTKREYFPDGAPFEGVGVAPDVPALLTRAQIVDGRDRQMEAAVAAVLASSR
jgi:carboxyl-terminal processing protease